MMLKLLLVLVTLLTAHRCDAPDRERGERERSRHDPPPSAPRDARDRSTEPRAARPKPAPEAEPAASAQKPKRWVKVAEVKGAGMRQSAPFSLQGGEQRIRYENSCGPTCMFSFYVLPEGHDPMRQGGFPEVMTMEESESSTSLFKPAGRYVIKVSAVASRWKMVIEERR